MNEATQVVLVRAIRVHNYGNGIVGIEIPSRQMTDEERNLLHNLYPHLVDKAYELLNQEALLDSLFTGPLPESMSHDVIECESNTSKDKYKKKGKHIPYNPEDSYSVPTEV
jgi:hypothetical protein